MKTLEQILEHGTSAERELVRLANECPTDPKQIIKNEIIGSSLFLAGTSGLSYALWDTEWLPFGLLGIVSDVGMLLSAGFLIQAGYAGYYFMQPKKWGKVMPSSKDCLFYISDNKFTYTPTPVEVMLCSKIYPKNNFEEINEISSYNYGFITDVVVREMKENRYIVQEASGADYGLVKVEKIDVKMKFEKKKTYFSIEEKYDYSNHSPIYAKLQEIKTPSISVLIKKGYNGQKIIDVFAYNRLVDSGEDLKKDNISKIKYVKKGQKQ